MFTCGHFKTFIIYCTTKRHDEEDISDPSNVDDLSIIGAYCGWKGCDKIVSSLRDANPKSKSKISSNNRNLIRN